ncbi:MAG: phosphoserine phosphatase [Ewingella americana]|jgi:phosphoserine phosphatase|uniref:Phosphoserine phosphatase n=1 Tax=Ewingella americana (strain ATCC 33852 / DSM 4580 / CCUG 14506 / JCM 5911 / LMG 7869 / NCTC 12157 / CDC 1468-78) TaxID=910964 RepID=A0A085GPS5_EWIA3|nr:phosphoserine phosphatase [Ewingella americana]KAA8728102.1 phosphoserine phosphatase [Ewingella americana]KFC85720.1 phosphoserine phosphatase [Ewingella americana ATCC 33852]MCI1680883.1 phosphoserine phosphatase [Ewingella americana]MCI1855311.1 phosphoserine phosphatase [Ewingella americana]MCI1862170.1 phosphoserine phosphatase [Ewingella americana]
MPNSLTYCDLPAEIHQWPGLPLSLSGDEVMPLDYRAGHTGWLLYGRKLDKTSITNFQRRLGRALVIVSAWTVDDYQVIRLAGALTADIEALAESFELDVTQLGKVPHMRTPGLLVMDMDSTAIEIECIDEIAKLAGVGEQVAEVTERAMRGELDFSASLRQRVATLQDADASILQQVRETLPLMPGLTKMVQRLQELGWHVAIASGGFTYYAEYLRDKLNLIDVAANELEIRDGKLTGRVIGPIVDAQYKADTLLKLAERLEIPKEQTVAIGDGANDLKMMAVAGMGIAYHAKPKVYEQAEVCIRHADLIGVLCILSGSLA